ncbi:hypothetical protein AX17_005440 [Amanita inopinata Kibby_2008]|nr:hypothetical protein AX17_005440 [Amanita inopinata Kibby_2008]
MSNRPSKKRKTRSGCNGLELSSAFVVLSKFRDSITTQPGLDNDSHVANDTELDVEVEEDALAQLNGLLQWMDSKLKSTVKLQKFSSITSDILDDMQISQGPLLSLKSDWKKRVEAAKLAGADQFMSSLNLHQFLTMLLHLIARPSEASARTWVDAFLYRASAMLSPGKRMALNVEYTISPVTVPTASGTETTLVGYMDYTVVVSTPHFAQYFVNNPGVSGLIRKSDSVLRFLVIEAKAEVIKLQDCLPQILTQLYASAKKLNKHHIRGALTNGYQWLFLILTVDPNGQGGSYRISPRPHSVAPQDTGGDLVIPDKMPDMIAGILATWIQHSCEDIGQDDWFEVASIE